MALPWKREAGAVGAQMRPSHSHHGVARTLSMLPALILDPGCSVEQRLSPSLSSEGTWALGFENESSRVKRLPSYLPGDGLESKVAKLM